MNDLIFMKNNIFIRYFRDSKISIWPSKRDAENGVLTYISELFKISKKYSEKEVNEILNSIHTFEDPAFIRRQLIDYGFLKRTKSGTAYWRDI